MSPKGSGEGGMRVCVSDMAMMVRFFFFFFFRFWFSMLFFFLLLLLLRIALRDRIEENKRSRMRARSLIGERSCKYRDGLA